MAASLSDCEGILARALADLNRQWDATSSGWRDKARLDFEKDFLEEMRWNAQAARQSMRGIHEMLRQAIQECS